MTTKDKGAGEAKPAPQASEPARPDRSVRVTFESPTVTCVIEISGTDKSLTLADSSGGKRIVTGERGRVIAQMVADLALTCALESSRLQGRRPA